MKAPVDSVDDVIAENEDNQAQGDCIDDGVIVDEVEHDTWMW